MDCLVVRRVILGADMGNGNGISANQFDVSKRVWARRL